MPLVKDALIYQLVVSGQVSGRVWNNITYWKNDGLSPSDPGSDSLTNKILENVVPAYEALMNQNTNVTLLDAKRLGSLTDFDAVPLAVIGDEIGDAAPPFAAFQIKKIRATKELRSGAIRVPGVSEQSLTVNGRTLEAAAVTAVEALAVQYGANQTDGGNVWQQVLVGNKYDTSVDPPVLRDEGDWTWTRIAALSVPNQITSQVSRK